MARAYHPSVLDRYRRLWPVLNWMLYAIGAVYCVAAIAGLAGWPIGPEGVVAGDARNYWLGDAYSSPDYRYSPAFYWLTAPLRALPWELFLIIWTVAHLVALAWLGPWTILLAFDDVVRGNINTFLAVAVVLAVGGQAWTWASVILTKVTPGVGILYHVGRREWRQLLVAVGSTFVLVVLTWPSGMWPAWIDSLQAATANYQTIDVLAPLPLRIGLGALLCFASVRWIWLLPVGMLVALPGLWPAAFALLAALPRLLRRPPLAEAPVTVASPLPTSVPADR